jgi:hypothetical protein
VPGSDLETCRVDTGRFAYNLEVDSVGRYSWKTPSGGAQKTAMVDCMRGKGYAPERTRWILNGATPVKTFVAHDHQRNRS